MMNDKQKEKVEVVSTDPVPDKLYRLMNRGMDKRIRGYHPKSMRFGRSFIFDDENAFLLCIPPRNTEENRQFCPTFVCSDSGEIFTWSLKVLPVNYQPKSGEETFGWSCWLVEVECDKDNE